ncbi:MAG: 3-deoxy-D-manno-octulosonate 8-phosphate phosphatase KdsC [bacterium]|nr:3-deoxy-D-manno-octulosonate 8-phosphate phosphatase KdsC [bacterium]
MNALYPQLADIRLLVLDVDGVLTDGGLIYDRTGLAFKRFQAKDGLGLKLLMLGRIEVALLSGDPSPITEARAQRLGIRQVLLGIDDKLEALRTLAAQSRLAFNQVAYMGDDLNDLPCLSRVGFGACPADAVPEVLKAVHYVAQLPGGAGCVREICDLIRHAQRLPVPETLQGPPDGTPVVDVPFSAAP